MLGLHPLQENIAALSDIELTKKIGELRSRANYAYNLGNQFLIEQVNMLLAAYEEELNTRNWKKFEEASKKQKEFSNIIDICGANYK